MKIRPLPLEIERMYKINGQHLEQKFRFNVTGKIIKADHIQGADIDDIQIKSSKATVCKGTDFKTFIMNDVANIYAYVIADGSKAYEMTKTEYIEFVENFSYIDTDSKKNGGAKKIRLREESKKMLKWFAER